MKKIIKAVVIAAILMTGVTSAGAAEISQYQIVSDPGGGGTGGK